MSRRAVLVATCLLIVEVPILATVVAALTTDWSPVSDWALIDLAVRGVGTSSTPHIGAYSRFGWNHPGPGPWYLLALISRSLGGHPSALLAATAVLHGVSLGGIVVVGFRRAGLAGGVLATGLATTLVRAMGPSMLIDPWNPLVPLVGSLLYLFLLWHSACGSSAATVGAMIVGSLVVQSHLGFAPLVILTAISAIAVWFWRLARERRWPSLRTWAASHPFLSVTMWIAVVILWLPPVVQQLTAPRGNLAAIWNYAVDSMSRLGSTADGESMVGFATGAHLAIRDLVVEPRWIVGRASDWEALSAQTSFAWYVVLGALFIGAFCLAKWTSDNVARRGLLLAGTAVASVVLSTSAIRGPAYWWLQMPTWSVGAFGTYLVALTWVRWGMAAINRRRAASAELMASKSPVWQPLPKVATAAGSVVGALSIMFAAQSTSGVRDLEARHSSFSNAMSTIAAQADAWMAMKGYTSFTVSDEGTAGFYAFGLMDGLDRAGRVLVVSDRFADVLLPGHHPVGSSADVTFHIAPAGPGHFLPPDSELVARAMTDAKEQAEGATAVEVYVRRSAALSDAPVSDVEDQMS